MNIKSLVTGLLLILAVAGVVYVLVGGDGVGGDDQAAEACDTTGACAPGCTGDAKAVAGATADGLPMDGVVVYYFHGNKRCQTCNRMEALAILAIDEGFADRQQAGTVVFKPVNIETDATRHFITDFEMTNRCVVMVERKDGKDSGWRRLDEVWAKIGDDTEYKAYITENLSACLANAEKGGA